MAGYQSYDTRLESLVMAQRTEWDAAVSTLADDKRQLVARVLHADPAQAVRIRYERQHTGFERIITVTPEDVSRILPH